MKNLLVLCSAVLIASVFASPVLAETADWSGWGGPNGDFSTSTDPGLATEWGSEGPKILWRQSLGDHGHSSIVVTDNVLFTSFRRGEQDVTRAVDVTFGEILWETAVDAVMPDNHQGDFGPGPHSTPLVSGDLVIAATASVRIVAFNRTTGEIRWQRDLLAEEGVRFPPRGYGPSPLAWKNLVIVNGGGDGQGVMALDRMTGATVWKAVDGGGGYSSPVLMTLDGVEQVVVALGPKRAGVDPESGTVLWELDLPESAGPTMSTQVQVGADRFFTSCAYGDGSRLIAVSRQAGDWQAEVVWYTRKMRIMHGTVASIDGFIYGSSGDFGPAFLAAVDLENGDVTFRQRGFAKANVERVGDRVLILDEDGVLAIGQPSPTGIEILAEHQVLTGVSWSAPALVGTTLLVRNRSELMAIDLAAYSGRSGSGSGDLHTETSAPAGFDRTVDGLTLEVPPSLLGPTSLPYYVFPFEDAQVVVHSDAALQRNRFVSENTVGFLVAPFDFDSEESLSRPLLGGALRIPINGLSGGSGFLRQQLFGADGLNTSEHPEIVVTFLDASDVSVVETDNADRHEFDLTARVRVEANGRDFELEVPVHLKFVAASMEAMNRYPGDHAVVTTTFEMSASQLGVEVPPFLSVILSDALEVEVYLGLTTVPPGKTLNPAVSQELANATSRYGVLARDLGDDVAAYQHIEAALKEFANDADGLEQLSVTIMTAPGVERRNLGQALRAATRASDLTSGADPMKLSTLARVLFERGDVGEAVATQRRALELLAAEAPQRSALETNLNRYLSAQGG